MGTRLTLHPPCLLPQRRNANHPPARLPLKLPNITLLNINHCEVFQGPQIYLPQNCFSLVSDLQTLQFGVVCFFFNFVLRNPTL